MNKFKVLLVYPNLQMVNLLLSNIPILSAYLKESGIDVRLFDATMYKTAEKSIDEIRVENLQLRPFNLKEKGVEYNDANIFEDFKIVVEEYKPDLIGVSATDDTYDQGIDLVSHIRDKGIFTIVGGVYPTFSPDKVINDENVDAICMAEGEEALVELCNKLMANDDITGVKNIWVKKHGKIYKNEIRKPISLNESLFEDFSIFEENRFFRPMQGKVYRMIPVTIDRGCPYKCDFCAAPLKRKMYKDAGVSGYYRVKSPARIIEEVKCQIERYKADYIYFNSETFFARGQESIEEFGREYAAKIGLPFWCQTRPETITERRVKILEDMNCDRVSIGLEHGNEEFRKKLNKPFTNEQAINAFKILEKSRIPVTVHNIIGFPGETRELAFDTIRLNRQIEADSITALFFVPYTGTPLRQLCLEKGYLDPNAKTNGVVKSSILNMPNFPPDAIKGLVRTFPLYVKLPESYFDKIEIAEQHNKEGDGMYAELRKIYYEDYF
tara:strand:- start:454 stop:1941 length:1488 start_codon:yes stop_codon:yes gene_type:complete